MNGNAAYVFVRALCACAAFVESSGVSGVIKFTSELLAFHGQVGEIAMWRRNLNASDVRLLGRGRTNETAPDLWYPIAETGAVANAGRLGARLDGVLGRIAVGLNSTSSAYALPGGNGIPNTANCLTTFGFSFFFTRAPRHKSSLLCARRCGAAFRVAQETRLRAARVEPRSRTHTHTPICTRRILFGS